MTRITPIVLSFSLIAFAGAAAAGGESKQQGASDTRQQSQQQSAAGGASAQTGAAMSAKGLIGTKVVDAEGKDMGEIKDVVLDLHNGRVHAAVLEFGGFLGVGEKQYAFPASQLKPADERNKLMLNVSKEKLKDAKGFDKDKWPAMSDEYWGRAGDKAGAGGTKAQGQKVNLHRASKLMGQEVQNKDGQPTGEIRDVLLSQDRAKIEHIVLDMKEGGETRIQPQKLSLGTGDKLMADVPAGKGKQGSAAGGASGAAGTKKSFSELDKDNDGALSQLEVAADADAKSNFQKLDKNNDMRISRDEWDSRQAAAGGTKK